MFQRHMTPTQQILYQNVSQLSGLLKMLIIPTAHELTVHAASPLEPRQALYLCLTYVVVSTHPRPVNTL